MVSKRHYHYIYEYIFVVNRYTTKKKKKHKVVMRVIKKLSSHNADSPGVDCRSGRYLYIHFWCGEVIDVYNHNV